MQQVFIARDLAFERDVALKVAKNVSAEKRFDRSARMSARVTHPNVAKTLDYFEEEGRWYLVEELIPGRDLGKALEETYSVLDPHLAAHLLHHLAKGVAAAHHAGVFHRDLKPTNIMVSDDPGISDLKVTDFGIARMAADEIEVAVEGGEQSMQGSSTTMGALPFMAPEMIESPRLADKPADVWAVGTITCRLLLGSPPFGAGLRAVRKILDVEMPSKPSVLSSKPQFRSLGDELWSIIEKCLVREPDDRPTADELVALCSEVCYSRAPRSFGTITSVKTKGFNWGWIRNDANQSVFYHEQSYYGPASKEHQRVSFAAFEGQPSSRAFPVLPLREPAEE